MLLRCLVQLVRTMLQRPLCQQVDHSSTTFSNPIYRLSAIHEAQHFDTLQQIVFLSVCTYLGHSFAFTFRHTCRSHFDTVNVNVRQQFARHYQLFVRQERYAVGLLTIAQRRVHNLHEGQDALVRIYSLCCSHRSILSLLATRKSMSSKPCIRQCFL